MERDRFANRDPGDESRAALCDQCGINIHSTWVDTCGYLVARCLLGHIYRVRLLTPQQQRDWPHGAA